MRFSIIIGLAAGAIAIPVADPLPAATAAANPQPVAAPAPTAMPQVFSANTPFGEFDFGYKPPGTNGPQSSYYNNRPQGGYYGNGPLQSSSCGLIQVGCIYSSISTAISDSILDNLGIGRKTSTVTIIYVPTPTPYYGNNNNNNYGSGYNGYNNNNGGLRNGNS